MLFRIFFEMYKMWIFVRIGQSPHNKSRYICFVSNHKLKVLIVLNEISQYYF